MQRPAFGAEAPEAGVFFRGKEKRDCIKLRNVIHWKQIQMDEVVYNE